MDEVLDLTPWEVRIQMEVLQYKLLEEQEKYKKLAWDIRLVQATDKDGKYLFKEFKDFYNTQEIMKKLDEGVEPKNNRLLEIARRNQEYLKNRGS